MGIWDRARSAYRGSPEGLRRALAPIAARVPRKLRYGKTFSDWSDDIRRSWQDPAFAVERTERQLRNLLAKAQNGSPYWRDVIADRNIQAFTLDVLADFPITTKETLSAAGSAACVDGGRGLVRATTSGSNGEPPFEFFVDADRSVREYAFVTSAWSKAGFRTGDARAVLRGFTLKGGRAFLWDAALAELRLAVYPLERDQVAGMIGEIRRRQIRFIHGYPSAIEIFCRHLVTIDPELGSAIQGVFPVSEPLFDHQRRLFGSVFPNAAVVPFYGLSEKVAFAVEKDGFPGVYTFVPLYGVAELVDDAGIAITRAGHEGRVIGTGFVSTGMPFIRYDTGDRARLVERPSRENGWRLSVDGLAPRRRPDYLYSAGMSRIVATDLVPESPVLLAGLAEWQLEQDAPGHCNFRYVLARDGCDRDARRVIDHLERRLSHAISFTPVSVERLPSTGNGKRQFIIHTFSPDSEA
jgi:phenylacetate-CoA ligase